MRKKPFLLQRESSLGGGFPSFFQFPVAPQVMINATSFSLLPSSLLVLILSKEGERGGRGMRNEELRPLYLKKIWLWKVGPCQ